MHAVFTVASKEFYDGLRNRWVIAITSVFCLMALALAYFGAAASGTVGFTSLPTTIVSLASLAVFIIPLIALLLAYDAIVGEDENGTLLLLLTYPLSRPQLVLGKFLGHGSILAVATGLGFGIAAVVIAFFAKNISFSELFSSFAIFITSATLLGWVFVAFAYLISVVSLEKSRAAGLALIIWFLFVLVFDLALLGTLVVTEGKLQPELFPYLLLLNPTDVFRLINLSGFEATNAYTGVIAIAADAKFSVYTLLTVLAVWTGSILSLAMLLFKRKTI